VEIREEKNKRIRKEVLLFFLWFDGQFGAFATFFSIEL